MSAQDSVEGVTGPKLAEGDACHISILVATCNRPDDLRRCLDSLTRVQYPRWDVLVLDQSDDDLSHRVAEHFTPRLPNLAYRHMYVRGKCRALNAGLESARGAVVAILDDDCTVDPNWLNDVAAAFSRHPDAALVFGTLKNALPDSDEYFVPAFQVTEEVALHGSRAFFAAPGYGASMYLRLEACQAIGGFDIHMGPGSRFFTSDDFDYYYRTLLRGGRVVMTPAIVVWHYGGRSYKSGAASHLFRISFYSHGALDMKLLRSGHLIAVPLIGSRIWRYTRGIRIRNLFLRSSPSGLARIVMYLRGLAASFRVGVDRRQCLYLPIEPADNEEVDLVQRPRLRGVEA